MAGPRWDELERAIRAKDSEAAERLWLELLEQDPGNVDGFLKGADGISERAGGRRQAGVLLWMVAGALKDKGRDRDLVRLFCRLARIAPDDGTLRQALIEAVRAGYAERSDVEALLDKSGVVGGAAPELAKQAEALERYLRLEPGAYVFHKTGWGIGRIAEYQPDRGRCVIDFLTKRGHGMDLLAAADLLERLPEDDLRVMRAYRPEELRKLAEEHPLDVLCRVLKPFQHDAQLRHVKDALVPDVLAKTEWAGWWKEAKKQALLDPAWTVGEGADPRVTFTPGGSANLESLVLRKLSFAKADRARRRVLRDFGATAAGDVGARAHLAQLAKEHLVRSPEGDLAGRAAWSALATSLEGGNTTEALAPFFQLSEDPAGLLRLLLEEEDADRGREDVARAVLAARPTDGMAILLGLALTDEDRAAAAAYLQAAREAKDPRALEALLGPALGDPLTRPLLYEWAADRLIRGELPGRTADAYTVAEQALRVLDGTEYSRRRLGDDRRARTDDRRQRAVDALAGFLAEHNCRLLTQAAKNTDIEGARHLMRLLERNQGLKPRLKEKLEDVLLRVHPGALTQARAETPAEAANQPIYMTAPGIEKLKRELDRILHEEMPSNASEIQRAREFGDLSENAEYHAAREKQAMLTARSEMIKGQLALAREIRPEIVRTDAVSVGSRVRLRDAAGTEVTYTLLGPADVDVDNNVINYQTPLARTLMGRKPGETVTLELLGDTHTYQVLSIACGV